MNYNHKKNNNRRDEHLLKKFSQASYVESEIKKFLVLNILRMLVSSSIKKKINDSFLILSNNNSY